MIWIRALSLGKRFPFLGREGRQWEWKAGGDAADRRGDTMVWKGKSGNSYFPNSRTRGKRHECQNIDEENNSDDEPSISISHFSFLIFKPLPFPFPVLTPFTRISFIPPSSPFHLSNTLLPFLSSPVFLPRGQSESKEKKVSMTTRGEGKGVFKRNE